MPVMVHSANCACDDNSFTARHYFGSEYLFDNQTVILDMAWKILLVRSISESPVQAARVF